MGIIFERQVGAAADAKELEYISALHQTDMDGLRIDGSIRGKNKMKNIIKNQEIWTMVFVIWSSSFFNVTYFIFSFFSFFFVFVS